MDINNECLKAGEIMSRYRVSREDQIEVVKILMACGVEHCLNEQEKIKAQREALVEAAYQGMVH